MYATSGKLVKIVLTNFMCHKHIEVTFHENVNVILGRNGSKSKYNILMLCDLVYDRWEECNNGGNHCWLRGKGNYHQ